MGEKQTNNWAAFGAAALALLLVIVALFINWGGFDVTANVAVGGVNNSQSGTLDYTLFSYEGRSWFDNDLDENEGIDQVRTGIILFVVGAAVSLGGAAILAIPTRVLSRGVLGGAALCLTGAVVLGLGALLHHLGALAFADSLNTSGGNSSTTGTLAMGTGLIMAYVAAFLFVAAGIVGLTWNPTAGDGHATT